MATVTESQVNPPPVTEKTPLPQYVHPPETKEQLDYADLVTLDMAEFDRPGGKERLAEQLKETAHRVGFFYITNFGLSQAQIDQQFAIAKQFFALPEEERMKYRAPLEDGNYNGYRPLRSIEIFPGLYDNLEFYNIFKFIPQTQRSQPEIFRQYWAEIEKFHRHMHENVSYKLLRLLAIILELPEDQLVDGHRYEANCDSSLRYMMYRARTEEENSKCRDTYLRGHTDNGTITYVFQQSVAALQVKRTEESDWQHLRITPGIMAVNLADMLQFLTNGYLKSGIHRVIAPPDDQATIDRLGLLYFVRPSDRLMLKTLDSPFLQRVGFGKQGTENDEDIPASEWVRARVRKNWTRSPSDNTESVKMGGFQAKVFYN
ncbi:hypothetical protein ASPWEDRAFT_41483 [Aspergillus wentii DTO 134E9]|uniref:Fe2OG dioxygenase domain-containing protein n=1 Tax=Aspergillus wentii DTO 134E9 TaxID=1073089 RepID=A0A1L9RFD1_ASPWE|nr:uncharacterized protein ASPWEDRAFT_41483 [Aspergillus wentii DTO 134E9]KAI9925395.1 hypothetical protein MW887_005776 [Aspergillus wentii]OJJ33625.1 hypothetical protein ASPWEDRAFT_41483 [Aspergillus wentii DTO 134E9]